MMIFNWILCTIVFYSYRPSLSFAILDLLLFKSCRLMNWKSNFSHFSPLWMKIFNRNLILSWIVTEPSLKPPHTWVKIGGRRGTNGENGQNACEFNELKINLTSNYPIINYCQIWLTNSKQTIAMTCDRSQFFGSLL
jgi:hypothetical protein